MSKVGSATAYSVKERLYAIQVAQWKHDERYHRDITILPVQVRLKHMALHMSKYAGQIAAAVRQENSILLKRSLVDIFIIGVAAANTLGLRLSKILSAEEVCIGQHLSELAQYLTAAQPQGESDTDLVFRVAESAGRLAKACESLDHLEPYPYRETIQFCIAELISISLTASHQRGMDLDAEATERLRRVEEKHLFYSEITSTN